MKKLIIIDSNSVVHRAFHAMPPMNSLDGRPTQAVYGFMNMLLKLIEDEKPDYLLAAFDTHAPTLRHHVFSAYKANRKETPDELKIQFDILKQLLQQLGISIIEKEGYEADDLLGIYAHMGEREGYKVRLLTGDKDVLQLVSDKTKVILMKKGISQTDVYDLEAIQEKYGLLPEQLIDVKGLMGDVSDNIPGVPGVGEKTALKLIGDYHTLENVLDNIDQISGPKLRENLRQYADQALMSREIGTILVEADPAINLDLSDCKLNGYFDIAGVNMMQELGFHSLLRRLPKNKDIDHKEISFAKVPIWKKIDIYTKEQLKDSIEKMLQSKYLTIARTEDISISNSKDLWIIHIKKGLIDEGMLESEILKLLDVIFYAEVPKKVFDYKEWMYRCNRWGVYFKNVVFDTMIAAYLLQSNKIYENEKALIEDMLGIDSYHAGALDICNIEFEKKLEDEELRRIFDEIEFPLVRVLFEMEKNGFLINREALKILGKEYEDRIHCLSNEIHEISGNQTFNIASPKQLGAVLFEEMGLGAPKKSKSGYSTDAQTLERIKEESPIIEKILEFRQNSKLKSTYIEGLLNAADEKGSIHTKFKQNGTTTGRLSSSEPNLQNIPVRSSLGREIRKAFIAREGNMLLSADYSQIELRILAHLAQDKNMIKAFSRDDDIHTATAALVASVELDQVSPLMRNAAKAINFGIVYGISDFGLSQQLRISRKEAQDYIDNYYQKYPQIKQYMDEIVEQSRVQGYVKTLFGRKRELPELRSQSYHQRSFGERAARNAPIQGTAADIIKIAMIHIQQFIVEKNLRAKLILQIHDELILDVPIEELEIVKNLVKSKMENVVKLSVPLIADIGWGKDWFHAK